MRNDGDDDPIPSTSPGQRIAQGVSIESPDLTYQSPSTEDELLDRIRRSTALRSVRYSIAMGGAGRTLDRKEKNGKDPVAGNGRPSYFDCNICFEAARDPVLTSCGHLFCWSCLYRWLHFDWDANECPVCEGEVRETSLIPIYGRGDGKDVGRKSWELELGLTVPPRPRAKRVESSRQSAYGRTPWGIEEAIRRIGNRANMLRQWIRSSRRLRGAEREETTHLRGNGVLPDEVNGVAINAAAAGRASEPPTVHPETASSASQQADSWLLSGGALQENGGIGRPGGGIRNSILGSVLNPHNWFVQQIPVEMAVSGVEFPFPARASMVQPIFGTLHVNLFVTGDGGVGEARESVLSDSAVLQTPSERFNGVPELDSAGSVPSLEGRERRRRRDDDSGRYIDDGIPPVSGRRRRQ